jgi:hypothetical protein
MWEHTVHGVGDRRVHRAAGLVARPEHEVVDEQLGAPVEQLAKRFLALIGVEPVLLVHRHPRQRASLPGELVAGACVLLLADEQPPARFEPVIPGSDRVRGFAHAASGSP